MSITLSALQKQRRDTAANWTAENPTLLAGEIGLESDTGYWKVGDGATAWTSLAYVTGLGAEIPVSRLADGTARQLLQTAANGTDVEWTSNIDVPGTLDVTGAATFDNNVIIQGDLTVNGTETIINTQTLDVEDKNIVIGKVTTPSDVTADGGGITLKGTTDKTINWIDATDAWTLSEHVNIASAKEYRIAGTKVLDATGLGSGVTGSSLTSVGTIGTGTWQGSTIATGYGGTGQTTYSNGQLLIGKTDGTLAKATITQGTGVTISNGDGSITISATGSGGTVTGVTATSPLASTGGTAPDISIQDGTTSQKGALQLEDSTSSTSTTKAATPNSVKSAYDLANAALPKAGGTLTGDVTLNAQSDLRFADADSSNWVALQGPATVSSNVTWTLPNADGTSGQVLSTNGSGTLSWATAGGGATDKIEEGNTSAEVIDTGSDGRFVVTTEGSERARIDSSGRLLIGTSSESGNAKHVVRGNTGSSTGAGVLDIGLGTTRPGSAGTPIGYIRFTSTSNTSSNYHYATIVAESDGTSSSDTDIPGRLVFSTTADGASSPTERMRIEAGGVVRIPGAYSSTTANAANLHVLADGSLVRSTSSEKYKTDVETIQDSYADALLQCRPVWYRSTCANDNPGWGWWGFIAEEVAAVDPRLVQWKTVEVTYDENGSAVRTPCEPEPEGVQYDRFVPHLLNLIKRQQQAIEDLQVEVAVLKAQ